MSKVAIVTDSTSSIPGKLTTELSIQVAPQLLIWDGQTYEDGVDIMPVQFYQRLKQAKNMPSTSQVTPASFIKVFTRLAEEGYDILAVLISEKLSGTIASAIQARELLPKTRIEIFDSRSAAMGLGYPVVQAARAAAAGASLEECKRIAAVCADNIGVFFAVDTLEFLHRGGRIGAASRYLGSALNIKPILELTDGHLEPIERVRTRTKAHNRLVELIEKGTHGKGNVRLSCMHANDEDLACAILERVNQDLHPVETILTDLSPVIGTHVGPGTIGLVYLVEP